jgi:hypothetical protein
VEPNALVGVAGELWVDVPSATGGEHFVVYGSDGAELVAHDVPGAFRAVYARANDVVAVLDAPTAAATTIARVDDAEAQSATIAGACAAQLQIGGPLLSGAASCAAVGGNEALLIVDDQNGPELVAVVVTQSPPAETGRTSLAAGSAYGVAVDDSGAFYLISESADGSHSVALVDVTSAAPTPGAPSPLGDITVFPTIEAGLVDVADFSGGGDESLVMRAADGSSLSLSSSFSDGVIAGASVVLAHVGDGNYASAPLSSVSSANSEGSPGLAISGDAVSATQAPPVPVVRGNDVVFERAGQLVVIDAAAASLVGSVAAPESSLLIDVGTTSGALVAGLIDDSHVRLYSVASPAAPVAGGVVTLSKPHLERAFAVGDTLILDEFDDLDQHSAFAVDASDVTTPATIVETPIDGPIVATTSTPTTIWVAGQFLHGANVSGSALVDATNVLFDDDTVGIVPIADGLAIIHGDGTSVSVIVLNGAKAKFGPVSTTFGPVSIAGSAPGLLALTIGTSVAGVVSVDDAGTLGSPVFATGPVSTRRALFSASEALFVGVGEGFVPIPLRCGP